MVAERRGSNKHVREGVSKDEFLAMRTERDRTVSLLDRMLHALEVNMREGARSLKPKATAMPI